MENTLAKLLTRALNSVNPLMGDGSRLVTVQYCELCQSSGLHEGSATRCDCWCHAARAAWGRRTPHWGSRPGVRAGGRRRGLPPARDVARAPAPSSARGRSKARGRRAVAAGGARSAPPAPLGHCPVCVNPMRRRIELRLFQGAAAAPALRGLGRCGLSAADVRAHFESGHFHPDPPLLIATLVDLLSRARADGGPAEGQGRFTRVDQPGPQAAPRR